MKVLWFSSTPSLYDNHTGQYNGRGWIESLEQLLSQQSGIELALAFFHPFDSEKVVRNGTAYYPIHRPRGRKRPLRQLVNNWRGRLLDTNYSQKFVEIINDFEPDVIQVFGTEDAVADIQKLTTIPVVIHLQGLINPCLNAYFPAGCSGLEFIVNPDFLTKTLKGTTPLHSRRQLALQASREKRVLASTRYVMGRTHWDEMVAKTYNPAVKYFHVDEVLRRDFYQVATKVQDKESSFKIISVLSPTIYKGLDVVLRAAKQLATLTDINFSWQIAGINGDDPLLRHFERKEKIDHQSVRISCLGKQSPRELVQLMCAADVFVHPSYLDNSPNAVCEAQMLGLPVIACDVGGLSSLIEHQRTGILVPANGVFELIFQLRQFSANKKQCVNLGENARAVALKRHDKKNILNQLLDCYQDIAH